MHEVHRRHTGRFRYSTGDVATSVILLETYPIIKIRKLAPYLGCRHASLTVTDDLMTAPRSVVVGRSGVVARLSLLGQLDD